MLAIVAQDNGENIHTDREQQEGSECHATGTLVQPVSVLYPVHKTYNIL
jgi:hypothetical protein